MEEKEREIALLKNEIAENADVLDQRNALDRQLVEQNKMLQNFQFAITAEIGQDLSETSFTDDENSTPVERIQQAITAYFAHQQTLRAELQVRIHELIK